MATETSRFWRARFRSTPGFFDVHLIIADTRTEAMSKVQDIIDRKSGPVFVELINEADIIDEPEDDADDCGMSPDELAAANRFDDQWSDGELNSFRKDAA